MRVFALSDIHVDFEVNARWVAELSAADYRDDLLILAGDVTDNLRLLEWCLDRFARCFRKVLFVPGNHDMWVVRDAHVTSSLEKFAQVTAVVEATGASMRPWMAPTLGIVPMFAWYDYSFGQPNDELLSQWADYQACRWPEGWDEPRIAAHFAALNQERIGDLARTPVQTIITFSHFLPRIDVMPAYIPAEKRFLYPVLGSAGLDPELRRLKPNIHVYGHSHVNRSVDIDGVRYINNAFGYPGETRIAAKSLLCIHEC